MISGARVLLYSKNPAADRAFFRVVLKFRHVDAGGGWLIFALPPAEAGIHPADDGEHREQPHGGRQLTGAVLYLMCDDLQSTVASLKARGVKCSPPEQEDCGIKTTLMLPSGGELGLYQPQHPTAI
jgi:hypothetical protein